MDYKINRVILLIVTVAIVLVFIVLVRFTPSANQAKLNVLNSQNITIGMKKKDVIKIMGLPDVKKLSFFNNVDTMYYYQPPFGASSGIYIQFSDSSEVVNQIIPYE
jgi:hypothetical protein